VVRFDVEFSWPQTVGRNSLIDHDQLFSGLQRVDDEDDAGPSVTAGSADFSGTILRSLD